MFEYVSLRVLHIAVTAAWFGITMGTPSAVRRASKGGDDRNGALLKQAIREAQRKNKLSLIFGVLTLITGLVLIFHMGGFGAVHRNVHTALSVVLLMLVISALMVKPFGARLVAAADEGDPEAVSGGIRRLTALSGVLQLFWLVTLVLMYWR